MYINKKGFTLIELMIVVAIILILGGIGAINIIKQIPARNLDSSARNMVSDLRRAKSMAVKLSRNVTLEINHSGDPDNTYRIDSTKIVDLNSGIKFGFPGRTTPWKLKNGAGADVSPPALTFTSLGRIISDVRGFIYLQNSKTNPDGYRIGIQGFGIISMEKCGGTDSKGAKVDCTNDP